jgi:hypothetical protein
MQHVVALGSLSGDRTATGRPFVVFFEADFGTDFDIWGARKRNLSRTTRRACVRLRHASRRL